jgi:phosphoenolpyruvate carboxykinase (ATP)
MSHFLFGYRQGGGYERGSGKAPKATFSACFGAPFMRGPASEYAALLGERTRRSGSACWLVNTVGVSDPCGVGEPCWMTRSAAKSETLPW